MSVKENYIKGIKAAFDETVYAQWMKKEGVRVFEGFTVEDVRELETSPWPRIGGNAVFINLYGLVEAGYGLRVVEIPPGGTLEPERECCQKAVLIEQGTGATEVWQESNGRKHTFEWGKGSLFAIPTNAWHRMYNLSQEPVKFLVMDNMPEVMRGFDSDDFVFNCPYEFRSTFTGDDERFFVETSNRYRFGGTNVWETNFVRDIWDSELGDSNKGYGNRSVGFRMLNKTLRGHVHQWPVGRYQKAHYHGSGRLLHPIRSEGFVLLWPKELGNRPFENGLGDDVVMEFWKAGGLYSPPGDWFHAHYNIGPEPARNMAIYGGWFEDLRPAIFGDTARVQVSTEDGGTLIEYPDEDPEIRRRFKALLEERGVPFDMPDSLFEREAARA
jgi:oxalate decarboxylase/phosphoglucose isomerase-like protein (cupin superfamily)